MMPKDKIAIGSGGKINQFTIAAVVAALFILLGAAKTFMRPAPAPETAAVTSDIVSTHPQYQSTTQKMKEKIDVERKRRALEAIEEHENAIALNLDEDESADRLMAVGNLHQYQLSDYYSAIQSYRMLVDTAPNHSQTPQAYVEIATCYERMGEEDQAMYVYREIVERLDPTLQHTQFAKLKLAGEYD
jgi:tetratricopeptide (TPR) repeat protein